MCKITIFRCISCISGTVWPRWYFLLSSPRSRFLVLCLLVNMHHFHRSSSHEHFQHDARIGKKVSNHAQSGQFTSQNISIFTIFKKAFFLAIGIRCDLVWSLLDLRPLEFYHFQSKWSKFLHTGAKHHFLSRNYQEFDV